jgi:glycerol uptake facilitator protein
VSIFGAEIIGTAILILLGNGVVAAVLLTFSKAQNGGWIVITFGWGLAVAMAVYAVGQFSGAHINPAVTLGLWAIGSIDGGDVPAYLAGQFIGAFIGATLVWLAYYNHYEATDDPGLKLATFSTAPAIRRTPFNFLTEFIGTFLLVFVILALGANTEAAEQTPLLPPLIVGLLVVGIGLSLGGPTGYAINPARDLGPRIMHAILPVPGKGSSDWSYAWVPVVAPILGGVVGALAFDLFFPG